MRVLSQISSPQITFCAYWKILGQRFRRCKRSFPKHAQSTNWTIQLFSPSLITEIVPDLARLASGEHEDPLVENLE